MQFNLLLATCFISCLSLTQGSLLRNTKTRPYRQVLHNHQNVQYYADFKIGNQEISGIFDTGSFELLVRSSRCKDCENPTPPFVFNESATYESNGKLVRHRFGSGPCVAILGKETVTVGDRLVAHHQAFWEIVAHKIQVMDTAKFAAIVGIGPHFGYGKDPERTLLMNYGINEFSICLKRGNGADGYLTWGREDNGPSDEETVAARVTGSHHWVTPLTGITFNKKADQPANNLLALPCSGQQRCAAIIDSGTSLIAAPTIALQQLSAQVGEIKEDCSNLHELPTLYFELDGQPMELPPQAYVMRISGATVEGQDFWDLLFFKPKIRKMDMCMPAFMQMDMASPEGQLWILGMPFFRYFHTTFDRTKKEMRFAKAGADCEALPLKSRKNALLSFSVDQDAEAYKPMEVDVSSIIAPRIDPNQLSKEDFGF